MTAASCTTNSLAPVVKVLHEQIGIEHGVITTIQDATNTQVVVDAPHKGLRLAGAASMSLIPTTTGSATAITLIYPELKGKLNGHADRVPLLTGSKNALKGAGFFFGGALLVWLGFRSSLLLMAAGLFLVLLAMLVSLPWTIGRSKQKTKFSSILSKSRDINRLSAARVFLFGSRDIWFAVGLPVFLAASLGWSFTQEGGLLALWEIGYGGIQALAPRLLRGLLAGGTPRGGTAGGVFSLAVFTALLAWPCSGCCLPSTLRFTAPWSWHIPGATRRL